MCNKITPLKGLVLSNDKTLCIQQDNRVMLYNRVKNEIITNKLEIKKFVAMALLHSRLLSESIKN